MYLNYFIDIEHFWFDWSISPTRVNKTIVHGSVNTTDHRWSCLIVDMIGHVWIENRINALILLTRTWTFINRLFRHVNEWMNDEAIISYTTIVMIIIQKWNQHWTFYSQQSTLYCFSSYMWQVRQILVDQFQLYLATCQNFHTKTCRTNSMLNSYKEYKSYCRT